MGEMLKTYTILKNQKHKKHAKSHYRKSATAIRIKKKAFFTNKNHDVNFQSHEIDS